MGRGYRDNDFIKHGRKAEVYCVLLINSIYLLTINIFIFWGGSAMNLKMNKVFINYHLKGTLVTSKNPLENV